MTGLALWAAERREAVDAISKHFSRSVPTSYYVIGVVGVVLLVVAWCLIVWLYRRRTDPARPRHPEELLTELCQAHGLSGAQRNLLERMATGAQVMPALVVAMPSVFDEATDQLFATTEEASLEEFERVAALRATLFDAEPDPAQEIPSPTAADERHLSV